MTFSPVTLTVFLTCLVLPTAWAFDEIDCINAVSDLPAEPLSPVKRAGNVEQRTLFRTAEDTKAGKPGILITRIRTPERYEVDEWPNSMGSHSDSESAERHAHFFLARDMMTFEIRTASKDGERSRLIVPETVLRAALTHFGPRVRSIKADWWRGTPEMDRYLAARMRGAGPKRAVFETWAGEQAKALGFTQVDIPFETQTKLQAFGPKGEPEHLTFIFTKPDAD